MNIKRLIVWVVLIFCSNIVFASVDFKRSVSDIDILGLNTDSIKQEISTIELSVKVGRYISASDLNRDIETLYGLGHFSKVEAVSTVQDSIHRLEFRVKENPVIKSIYIKDASSILSKRVYNAYESLLNQPFNPIHIQSIKDTLEKSITDEGYDFFEILFINYISDTQELEVVINEGIIDELSFEGLNKVDESVLYREMRQKKGVVFNSKEITKDRDNLSRLGYFTNVSSPKFKNTSKENAVSIVFDVIEKKVNRIEGGIERDQEVGFFFTSIIHNHVFINSDRIASKYETNFQSSLYSISYRQPWLFNRYQLRSSLAFYAKEIQENVSSELTNSLRKGALLSLGYPLSQRLNFESQLNFESVESTVLESSDIYIPNYSIHSLEFNLNYSSAQHQIDSEKGYYWSLSYERGNDLGFAKLGGITFNRFSSSLAYFKDLSKKATLALRTQYGRYTPNTESVTTFEDEYFVVGGSSSVRGYNEALFPFTGTRKLLLNLECRYDMNKVLQTVLFFDSGLASNNAFSLDELITGYGLGFRYKTPIGPIRVDFAQGDSFFIHFGFGQVF